MSVRQSVLVYNHSVVTLHLPFELLLFTPFVYDNLSHVHDGFTMSLECSVSQWKILILVIWICFIACKGVCLLRHVYYLWHLLLLGHSGCDLWLYQNQHQSDLYNIKLHYIQQCRFSHLNRYNSIMHTLIPIAENLCSQAASECPYDHAW